MNTPQTVVFAYADIGHTCLKFLLDRGENVTCVYTHNDKPGENVWFPSVQELAQERSIPVRTEENLTTESEASFLGSLSPDLLFSFYYRNILPAAVLKIPCLGAYNMHGSLLPRYRGRAPVNWAVLNGEIETGATLHVMEEKPDAGDIVDREAVAIDLDDTALVVQQRVTKAAVKVLERQIENLKTGKAPRTPQNSSFASYFGRRRPEDGEINWGMTARQIHNLVRAVTHPYPGAYGNIFGQKTWIWKTRLSSLSPHKDGLFITCGDGKKLEVLIVQREGEKEMTGQEFAKRYEVVGRENR